MKTNLIRIAILFWILALSQGCGGDNPPKPAAKTPEQLAIESLTGTGMQTWIVAGGGSVTKNSTVITDLYTNFDLILSSGTAKGFTTKNNNDLFESSGNWSFAGTNFDKITLTGTKPASNTEISITQTGDNLRLEFIIPLPGGRILGSQAIAGSYVFNLKKQ